MTSSGLRREAARGRLLIERIAGKDYTTLANIERMRQLCRIRAKVPDCGSGQKKKRRQFGDQHGSIDRGRHFATGCLAHENDKAERKLAEHVAIKQRTQ